MLCAHDPALQRTRLETQQRNSDFGFVTHALKASHMGDGHHCASKICVPLVLLILVHVWLRMYCLCHHELHSSFLLPSLRVPILFLWTI